MAGHRSTYNYGMTDVDELTYAKLKEYMDSHAYAPSLTEFSEMLGISATSASRRISQLEKKKKLRYMGTCMKIELME